MNDQRRICDYEDSSYRTDFWEGQGREYEDLAERIALGHLMPPPGGRLIDIGGGFGRLSEFYKGYEQVIVLDYSRSLLRQAQAHLGKAELNAIVVQGDAIMAGQGQFQSAAQAKAVDGGNDRLGKTINPNPELTAFRTGVITVDRVTDIKAGRITFFTGAVDNGHPHI